MALIVEPSTAEYFIQKKERKTKKKQNKREKKSNDQNKRLKPKASLPQIKQQ